MIRVPTHKTKHQQRTGSLLKNTDFQVCARLGSPAHSAGDFDSPAQGSGEMTAASPDQRAIYD